MLLLVRQNKLLNTFIFFMGNCNEHFFLFSHFFIDKAKIDKICSLIDDVNNLQLEQYKSNSFLLYIAEFVLLLESILNFSLLSLPAADAVCTGPDDSSSCVSPWLWSYRRWWSTENTAGSHADLHHNEMTICFMISYNVIAGIY